MTADIEDWCAFRSALANKAPSIDNLKLFEMYEHGFQSSAGLEQKGCRPVELYDIMCELTSSELAKRGLNPMVACDASKYGLIAPSLRNHQK